MTCSFYLQADMIQEARSARWPQSVFEADEDHSDLSDSGKRFYNDFEARKSLDGHSDIPTAMKDLIHAAMYSLLIGSYAVPRIKMIKEMQSPSLLILAPQVFNMKHLAVRVLVDLGTLEVDDIKRNAAALAGQGTDLAYSSEDMTAAVVSRKIWQLMQSQISPFQRQRLQKPQLFPRNSSDSLVENTQDHSPCESYFEDGGLMEDDWNFLFDKISRQSKNVASQVPFHDVNAEDEQQQEDDMGHPLGQERFWSQSPSACQRLSEFDDDFPGVEGDNPTLDLFYGAYRELLDYETASDHGTEMLEDVTRYDDLENSGRWEPGGVGRLDNGTVFDVDEEHAQDTTYYRPNGSRGLLQNVVVEPGSDWPPEEDCDAGYGYARSELDYDSWRTSSVRFEKVDEDSEISETAMEAGNKEDQWGFLADEDYHENEYVY
ncbi:hypothetical protein C8034_v009138 [Colletotrichum sidae]|uniref:Uncharacterized protein n=1 Tax=Colletotrichum sidae TaxID=1347389 RepID=A0A4R8TGN9_9PEZI|nr:hypothetical protein C8034_v009138 [Colletotrichum sidae]